MQKPIPRRSTTSSVNSIRPDRVRFARRLLFCAALLMQALSSTAQNKPAQIKPSTAGYFDATNLRQPTDLSATWLIHAGDDPDGSKGWAQPNFDDSTWTPCDPNKSLHDYFPNGNPGIVWYRLHVKVAPSQTDLALEESQLSTAVEGFTNGIRIFQVGQVTPFVAYSPTEPLINRIPADQIQSGNIVIALRENNSNHDWNNVQPGLVPSNLLLGQEEALHEHVWLFFGIGVDLLPSLDGLIFLGLGIAAILLYSAQSRRKEYLWLSLICAAVILNNAALLAMSLRNIPVSWLSIYLLIAFAGCMGGVMMYFAFIGRPIRRSVVLMYAAACLVYSYAIADQFSFFALTANQQLVLQLPYDLLIVLLVPALLLLDWRRGNREAGILLIPLLLSNFVLVLDLILSLMTQITPLRDPAIQWFNRLNNMIIGPILISPTAVTDILYAMSMALIILLRTNRLSREGAVFESELAAAREVQQVLVPEAIETIPGFSIETAYLPAQQVGGDFFQIVPTSTGGLLLVLGDVAGKGLPAAMLVSVLVGAIRTLATYNHTPQEVLAQLNARMIGRSNGGFSTALAAHIEPNGHVTIANAGHLSPYLDGQEIELPGALPLGIVAGTTYQATQFELSPSSRLTFYSDGVIEAQNPKGELFGFDRSQAISTQPAAAIAEQAKAFGQSDDITVLAILRTT